MSGDWIEIETDAGLRKCQVVEEDGQRFEIATGMGVPVVAAKTVTLASGLAVDGAIVSMGNPQFVTFIEGEEFALFRPIVGGHWQGDLFSLRLSTPRRM